MSELAMGFVVLALGYLVTAACKQRRRRLLLDRMALKRAAQSARLRIDN